VLAVNVLVLFAFLLLSGRPAPSPRYRAGGGAHAPRLRRWATRARSQLRLALRRFDHLVIREMLLHLALDLRGEESADRARSSGTSGCSTSRIARLRAGGGGGAPRRRRTSAPSASRRVPGLVRPSRTATSASGWRSSPAPSDLGTQEALAALVPMLGDPSPAVARQAQDILAERGRKVAREIRAYVRHTGNRPGRLAAVELLGWHRAPEAARLLLELRREADPEVRVKAVKAAAAIGDPGSSSHSTPCWPIPRGRSAATPRGAWGSSAAGVVAPLRPLLADRYWWVRYHAAVGLGEAGAEGRSALEEARGDPIPGCRRWRATSWSGPSPVVRAARADTRRPGRPRRSARLPEGSDVTRAAG
jgi:hypothetical protein